MLGSRQGDNGGGSFLLVPHDWQAPEGLDIPQVRAAG